jgi:hypothetical protein
VKQGAWGRSLKNVLRGFVKEWGERNRPERSARVVRTMAGGGAASLGAADLQDNFLFGEGSPPYAFT